MIQENPALTQEQFKAGGIVEQGVTHYARKSPTKINEELFTKIDDFIAKSEGTLSKKALGEALGYKTVEKGQSAGQGGLNKIISAWEESRKAKFEFKPAKVTAESPQVKKVMEEYKKLGSKRAVEQSTGISRKSQRGYFKQFKPEEIKPANIAGPTTGAKELKKRRLEIIKDLKKYWKSQKGGELILKQMDKKLADIAAENKSILKMSDDAIWGNKKYQDAMRLNVKALKTGEGLKFDRYPGISKKDFAKSVRDLAAKGEFVQPEHLISLKNKDPKSLLPKNIFSAYGKVGGQMEVLKDFSKANTIGKRPKEVFNFLKGQNIPIEKPGFWKATKKYALKPLGKAAAKVAWPVGIGLEAYFMKDILDRGGSWGQALSAPLLLDSRVRAMEEKAKSIGALDAERPQEELIEEFAAKDYRGYAKGGIVSLKK